MSGKNGRKRGKRGRRGYVAKPTGLLAPRVKKVGPERFGIVCVDCAKVRSEWMLADFYGKILLEPTTVTHDKLGLAAMVAKICESMAEFGLEDLVVAIERTGNYHRPVQRACRSAGLETRIVHPFATKQFRLPADAGNKTDPNDLMAMHRAVVSGFGLIEQPLNRDMRQLRLLVRHRRDLVGKSSRLRCQMREQLEGCMPGYGACFKTFFEHDVARALVREFGSAAAILDTGVTGMASRLGELGMRFQRRTLDKAEAWAKLAGQPDQDADIHQQIFVDLEADWQSKRARIGGLEREIAALLVHTPYLLLLAIPGLNVVSAGELAGEMGPIEHYANPNAITGRAGIFPSRYQSDKTDRADGPIVRRGNRRLRGALMQIADNLLAVNGYFRGLTARWRSLGVSEGTIRIRIVSRFRRLAYTMVSGRRIVPHECCQRPDYILDKLLRFHQEHGTPMPQILADLSAAADQLPGNVRTTEAVPLTEKLDKIDNGRTRGPKHIRSVLVKVLVKLGEKNVEWIESEEQVSS